MIEEYFEYIVVYCSLSYINCILTCHVYVSKSPKIFLVSLNPYKRMVLNRPAKHIIYKSIPIPGAFPLFTRYRV